MHMLALISLAKIDIVFAVLEAKQTGTASSSLLFCHLPDPSESPLTEELT